VAMTVKPGSVLQSLPGQSRAVGPALGLQSRAMSGTYAEPGSGTFRTERQQLLFACRYCGLEIILDDGSEGTGWHHELTGDPQCQPLSQAVPR
jgi:hypothetical protein